MAKLLEVLHELVQGNSVSIMVVSNDDIEKAVTKLTFEQHAEFRAWFEAYDAQIFDEKIARDAEAGKLDRLAAKARKNYRAGRREEI